MPDKELSIYRSMMRDMTEGLMTIDPHGTISLINKAGCEILGLQENVVGSIFAMLFLDEPENDSFVQLILDAIYERSASHNALVPYFDGKNHKKLFVNSSFLTNKNEQIGIVVVISDFTELDKLRDAVLAMEKIQQLNEQLTMRNKFIRKTFGRYLSDEIVQSILDSDSGLEIGGKKEYITIMLTDLRGFTAISETTSPQDLISMLNNYLSVMIDTVAKHNGTILKFMGDAILAIFGAPIASPSSEYDAVSCAIEMQCKMAQVNEHNRNCGFPILEMGIGIHYGSVIIGNIGSESNTKFDIVGRNVNITQRIEACSVGGQVIVSEPVYQKLIKQIKVKEPMEIYSKGVQNALKIYEVEALDEYQIPSQEGLSYSLTKAINIGVHIMEDKILTRKTFNAKLLQVSEKKAVISCELVLEKLTDIKIVLNQHEVYAKVVKINGGEYTVHYTMGNIPFTWLS